MTLRSTDVPDEIHETLRDYWTSSEVVEIAAVAGLFNYFNVFNNALGVPPTEPSRWLGSEGSE